VDLRQSIRREIALLEAEELELRKADRDYWKNPRHDPETEREYLRRGERFISLRKELSSLYSELCSLPAIKDRSRP